MDILLVSAPSGISLAIGAGGAGHETAPPGAGRRGFPIVGDSVGATQRNGCGPV